jgi:predicted nucleotidyltransferase
MDRLYLRLATSLTPRYNSIMISQADEQAIRSVCRKYGVKRVLLFGSSLDTTREARDIDLAVEGLAPQDFFAFYGDLMFAVSKPIDLVNLSGQSKFLDLIRREGVALYG